MPSPPSDSTRSLVLLRTVALASAAMLFAACGRAGVPAASATSHTPSAIAPPGPAITPKPKPRFASPAPIPPLFKHSMPGEGVFHQPVSWVAGGSPIRYAWYRSDRAVPSILASVVWIDPTRIQLALYPGTLNPPSAPGDPRGPAMVPAAARSKLLAAFNSGFYISTPHGAQPGSVGEGFVVNGHVYSPLRRGLATLLVYADGGIDIRPWTGGAAPPPGVVVARQNLPMLVSARKASSLVANDAVWGAHYHGEPLIARTAACVNASGQLLYIAAPDQTAPSIAKIALHVGCVRAMQLDVNNTWPLFIVYGTPGGGRPRMLFPNVNQNPHVFTKAGEKDFFAIYLRRPGVSHPHEPF